MARIALVLVLVVVAAVGLAGCGTADSEARFAAKPTNGSAPMEVQFTDLSQGDIDTWEWDFDNDGVVDSTLKNPKCTYRNAGAYIISLTVSGPGGTDTETKTAYVEATLSPPQANSFRSGCCGSRSSPSQADSFRSGCSRCESAPSEPLATEQRSSCGCG